LGSLGPRCRRRPRGQERQGIDIALVFGGYADPEVDERLGQVDDAARTNGADDRPLCDGLAALDGDRPEVHEGRRITGRQLDRDRLSAGRHGAGEGDDARRRRAYRASRRCADVETTVLTARIRVRTIEREGPQDRTVDRPRPRLRDGNR
jgi:hypothetical protein